jgi:anti-sigma B factor antagonist
MTIVPARDGSAILICDRCGHEDTAAEAPPDGELVWPLVVAIGWTGSPFATGAHRCPPCSLGTPAQDPAPVRQSPTHGASYDIRTGTDPGIAVITPLTDLYSDLAERLRDDLMRAAASCPHLFVDMHAVRFIDSAGLGLLVRARQQARHHDATFDLIAPSRFVITVLHTMRLDPVFRTFTDLETALKSLRRQAAVTGSRQSRSIPARSALVKELSRGCAPTVTSFSESRQQAGTG